MEMVEYSYDYCPECGGTDTYEAECSNTNCSSCVSLFFHCNDCGYTDHECEEGA